MQLFKKMKVSVSVKYLDNRTKAAQITQFELTLYFYQWLHECTGSCMEDNGDF